MGRPRLSSSGVCVKINITMPPELAKQIKAFVREDRVAGGVSGAIRLMAIPYLARRKRRLDARRVR